jgi:predicted negative regulator of RcsB-dependent stress response
MQDGFGQALMRRTLGELELAQGDPEAAREHLDHAMQWWNALALPVWRARTLRDLASVHEALGDPVGAREAWEQALAIFREHGSREATEPKLPQAPLKDDLEVSFRA